MTFVLTRYLSRTFTSTLRKFELFAVHLTDPTAQNVKAVFFAFDLTLTFTLHLYLEMLNMH